MSQAFDFDAFCLRNATIIMHSHGKSFHELIATVEALRGEYAWIHDREVQTFIERTLNRSLLMFAVDSAQPYEVVDRLYDQLVKQGFVEPHAEVSSAIDYAAYCYDLGNHEKGLSVVRAVKESLSSNQAILPQSLPNFLKPIDTWIGYFEEAMDQQ